MVIFASAQSALVLLETNVIVEGGVATVTMALLANVATWFASLIVAEEELPCILTPSCSKCSVAVTGGVAPAASVVVVSQCIA